MIEKNLIRVEFTLTKWNSLLQLSQLFNSNYSIEYLVILQFNPILTFRNMSIPPIV